MRRLVFGCIALAVVLGFGTSRVLARGGHGGGHRGGHHGGHHGHHSHHHSHHGAHHGGQHHHFDHHHHHSHWAHHNRPFSHGWYGRHGGRWGYGWGGWNWGNPWVPASYATTTNWLGMQGAAPLAGDYGSPVIEENANQTNQQVVTSNQQAPAANQQGQQVAAATPAQSKDDDKDDDGDDDDDSPQYTDAEKNEAAALAQSKVVDPNSDVKFLPLGVFTLAPEDQDEASALVQLAAAQDGTLRGTYYDLLSDHAHPVRGAIDKKTQKVAFRLGPNGKILFETSLPNVTNGLGGMVLHYENGDSRNWTLARYAKEPTENDKDDDDKIDAVKKGRPAQRKAAQ